MLGITPEAISISQNGQQLVVADDDGNAAITSASPTLYLGTSEVEAKFVQIGTTVVITPAHPVLTSRAACASSFWGNAIFNVGMTGVCGTLAVGTVIGGPICSAAVIAANTQINWDAQCK